MNSFFVVLRIGDIEVIFVLIRVLMIKGKDLDNVNFQFVIEDVGMTRPRLAFKITRVLRKREK